MTAHHPHDDLLLGYAAGTLDHATAVLIAAHLALCPACRQGSARAEAVGGALIDDLAPAAIGPGALDAVLARCDECLPAESATATPSPILPRPVCDLVRGALESQRWHWRGRGIRYLPLAAHRGSRLGLLQVAAGQAVPRHGHSDDEFTLVLAGGYRDAGESYNRGDVQCADAGLVHQPIAESDAACLCLVVTRAPIRPRNPLMRLLVQLLPV